MSLRQRVPFRTGELPVDNLGLEIDSRVRAGGIRYINPGPRQTETHNILPFQ